MNSRLINILKKAGLLAPDAPAEGRREWALPPRPGDYRHDFILSKWQQGELLDTWRTSCWPREQRKAAHAREQRWAFAHFNWRDEGRGRQFLFEFQTAEDCRRAVDEHNRKLARAHRWVEELARRRQAGDVDGAAMLEARLRTFISRA